MAEVDEHIQTRGPDQPAADSVAPTRPVELKASARWGTRDRDPGGDAA